MNLYEKHILPRLIDLGMRRKESAAERAKIVPRATGVVLEVGIGSGLNLAFYGSGVERVYGIDPSLELWKLGRGRWQRSSVPVKFVCASGEFLPFRDKAMDTVLMTWTLCSIPNPHRALEEIRRVLRPDGRLIFVEHGLTPDRGVATWQTRLNPLWHRVAGGCNLNRAIDVLIADAGLRLSEIERGYGVGPKPFTYLYRGIARPSVG